MKISSLALAGVLAACLSAPAISAAPAPLTLSPQTTFFETEPNDTKADADEALEIVSGDRFGFGSFNGTFDPDVFRVRPAALPPGIYRHIMRDDTSPQPSQFRALGLDGVVGAVLPDSLSILSDSADGSPAEAMVAWYGFGKAEELYVEMQSFGFSRTGSATDIVFETEPVVPIDIGTVDPFAGFFEVLATGTGNEADTELFVFDSEYNLIPSGWNDDGVASNDSARAHPTLTPGRYYVAVSTEGLSSHLPPPVPQSGGFNTEFAVPSGVTDFKGPLVAGNFAGPTTVLLTIRGFSSGGPTLNAPLTIPGSQSAAWATFTVGSTQESSSFCPGDGTAVPCPCGSDSASGSGVGCRHSEGRGASLITGRLPFGPVRIALEGLPRNAASLVFVSMGTQAPEAIRGGLLCLNAPAVRLPVVFADGAGSAEIVENLVGTAGYMSGMTVFSQAAYRDTNAATGCRVNFTSGAAFQL